MYRFKNAINVTPVKRFVFLTIRYSVKLDSHKIKKIQF